MRKEDKSTIIEQIAATVKEYGHFYFRTGTKLVQGKWKTVGV